MKAMAFRGGISSIPKGGTGITFSYMTVLNKTTMWDSQGRKA